MGAAAPDQRLSELVPHGASPRPAVAPVGLDRAQKLFLAGRTQDEIDLWEERAAILQYEAAMPRDIAEREALRIVFGGG